jgi:thiamine biosynthesis lipoprotein
VDEALKVLRRLGINRALVAGGGDIAVAEPPPGARGWRIELAPLDAANAPPARFVFLSHAAIATSGDLFQRLEIDGKRYSHIVDPRTGIGLTDHSLVSVIAADCMTADSLTKVISVLGPNRAADTSAGAAPEAALTMGSFRKARASASREPASMVHSCCRFDAPIGASTCPNMDRDIPCDPGPHDGAESERPTLPACP